MWRVGQEEADAVARVILSGELFRYHEGGECERFEKRYAEVLGVKHCTMTTSGTTALTAALVGLGIGPGDEVIVPCCTYMATAIGVLAAGAIPIIVDIDETLMMDPNAMAAAVGPRTRAVIPVHMWGLVCDMDAIGAVAKEKGLLVVEDACQCVGGAYKGRMTGSIGDAGAFSFNYYKNMTCGEGGAVVTNRDDVARVAFGMVDCCNFYWTGRDEDAKPFASNGSRASEIMGAMMNVQLDRIAGMVESTRAEKKRILAETSDTKLAAAPSNSPDWECGAHVVYTLPSEPQADRFAELTGGTVAGKTGRHVYTEWDQVLGRNGAYHPAMNPYNFPANAECRTEYSRDQCARSLDILNRSVLIATHPDHDDAHIAAKVASIRSAAADVL